MLVTDSQKVTLIPEKDVIQDISPFIESSSTTASLGSSFRSIITDGMQALGQKA